MSDLSPAAQAVLDAYEDSSMSASLDGVDRGGLAAALRAAAEHLMPLTKTPWGSTLIPILTAEESRNGLLAIADEPEAP